MDRVNFTALVEKLPSGACLVWITPRSVLTFDDQALAEAFALMVNSHAALVEALKLTKDVEFSSGEKVDATSARDAVSAALKLAGY